MSKSSAVQVDEVEAIEWQATGTGGGPNLKQVAAERLAAHRNRRAAVAAHEAELDARTRQMREMARRAEREDQRRGASVVRDAVKARYAQRESYREFLAMEAERAIQQAQAEAEVAARSARAVAEAQMQLLDELDSMNRPEPGPREQAFAQAEAQTRGELAHALADIVLGARELISEPPQLTVVESGPAKPSSAPGDTRPDPAVREISAAGLTVRLFEDIPSAPPRLSEINALRGSAPVGPAISFFDETEDDLYALEEEIAFRRAPEFPVATVLETQAIPGNLIEFPRELVAPRRARPRLAEGPLREEGEPQLRIFEVDAVQVAPEPEMPEPQAMPDWQSLMLDSAMPVATPMPPAEAQAQITLPPQTAPLERRLMSAVVDGSIVLAAWMGFVAVVAEICGPALKGLALPSAAGVALGSLGLFAIMYQLLFFTFSEGTPGMRWARIALCTFGDGNPTRKAMRHRIFSTLLAACPLGLGLAWVWMDNDALGWHDRMSRMYQRAY